jgi:hypothetical protein
MMINILISEVDCSEKRSYRMVLLFLEAFLPPIKDDGFSFSDGSFSCFIGCAFLRFLIIKFFHRKGVVQDLLEARA